MLSTCDNVLTLQFSSDSMAQFLTHGAKGKGLDSPIIVENPLSNGRSSKAKQSQDKKIRLVTPLFCLTIPANAQKGNFQLLQMTSSNLSRSRPKLTFDSQLHHFLHLSPSFPLLSGSIDTPRIVGCGVCSLSSLKDSCSSPCLDCA